MFTVLSNNMPQYTILPSFVPHISKLLYISGGRVRGWVEDIPVKKEWAGKASLSKRIFISALLKSCTSAELIYDISLGPFLPSFHLSFC